jgi:hypothetical protein
MKVVANEPTSKPGYSNRWFGGKNAATARRSLKRWTETRFRDNMKSCGNLYGHYFNYKIANAVHVTKRQGTTKFYSWYQKNGYYVVKDVFRKKFLEVIKAEISQAEKPYWVRPEVSHGQVKVCLLKTHLEKPKNNGGCTFLHNFLDTVVKGTFGKKNIFEVGWLKTKVASKHKWIPCKFHIDIGDPPAKYLEDHEKSPITLYFAIDDKVLELDIIPKPKKTGPKPKARTVTLNPGDILLYDPCLTCHRTATPVKGIYPERLNIVMTGFKDYMELEVDSGDSDSE